MLHAKSLSKMSSISNINLFTISSFPVVDIMTDMKPTVIGQFPAQGATRSASHPYSY